MNTTQTENSAVAEMENSEVSTVPRQSSSASSLMMNDSSMDRMIRMAEVMACGRSTLPQHFHGNVGDCMAVVMQSVQWNMNPFAVAQKTHVVNGTLGYEAQLVAAVINNSGMVLDRFHYEWYGNWEKIIGKSKVITKPAVGKYGDGNYKKETQYRVPDYDLSSEAGLGVKVWATLKGEAEPRELQLLLVQASVRNSTLWASDPKQQLAYLAVKRWARLYAPDVILGVYTPDEFEAPQPRHMGQADIVREAPSPELLAAAQAAASKGVGAYQEFWKESTKDERKLLGGEHESLKAQAISTDKNRTVDTPHPEAKPAPEAAKSDAPIVTFAKVMEMLVKAKNEDSLAVGADWIGEVSDPVQRAELTAKYEQILSFMRGES
jgi:hypothetical protein